MADELRITVLSGVSTGDVFRFALEPGGHVTIGRAPDNDLVLQDQMVSRHHATIDRQADGFFIKDAGSSHGTVHMGFRLESGDQHARRLGIDDEFKVGESLFRVSYSETLFQKQAPVKPDSRANAGKQNAKPSFAISPGAKRHQLLIGVLVVALIGVAVMFLMPSSSGNQLPAQQSDVIIDLPQNRVIGNLQVGKGKENADQSHLDKAQFRLPASDLVVEYDYQSETPVEVLIGRASVGHLEPFTSGWQHRQIIVRDVLSGEERILIFDNPDFPKPAGSKSTKNLRWGVKNVRATPLSREAGINFRLQFSRAVAQTETIDKSPESLFLALRAFQRTLIEALHELNYDAVDFGVPTESNFPSLPELEATLLAMKNEQTAAAAPDVMSRHFLKLQELTGRLDSELWRRVNSRLIKVNNAVSVKDYIEAHDNLIATMAMFPDGDDLRWTIANKMFNDTKVVPKKIKARPSYYRKK